MRDADCTAFLQWALPQLDMHWPGFRKVRRQVCKRVRRRIDALGLSGFDAYRERLESDAQEWQVLDQFCHVTISRFLRDRGVFDCLRTSILPAIAERARSEGRDARCWSAGCASGEEPYTLGLLWHEAVAARFPGVRLEILATDVDPAMLRRARAATYEHSSLRELPMPWRERGFLRRGGRYVLRAEHRRLVTVRRHELRGPAPAAPFDLVLCRNLAFTYFGCALQHHVIGELVRVLRPGGALVIGLHEELPDPAPELQPWPDARAVYRRVHQTVSNSSS
jgi:chemotaxis protein methyltransferase CheR